MPASRVAQCNGVPHVEPAGFRELAQPVDRRGNVLERSRIATTGLTQAPVLDVPDCDTVSTKVLRRVSQQIKARQIGTPASAMDHDDNGMDAFSGWQPQIGELA